LTYSEFVRMVATSDRQPKVGGGPSTAAASDTISAPASPRGDPAGAASPPNGNGSNIAAAVAETRLGTTDRAAAGYSGASPRAIRPQ
jgi:hypothetical protein